MKRWIRWFLWLGLIALIGGAIYLAIAPQPLEVEWATVSSGTLEVSIQEDGMTRIKDRYVVSSNVGGSLLRIELRPGDEIKQGQTLLATIQPNAPSMLDARQLQQAKATVEAAKVAVDRADAQKDQAKAAADLAEAQFGRAKQLFESKSIARDEYDLAVANHRARQEDLRVGSFSRKIADFELAQAEAALAHFTSGDSTALTHIEIRAPIDGRVLRVLQESATVLNPGTPLLEVGNPIDLEIVVDVLSGDAVKAAVGDEVLLEQWGGDHPLKGIVRVIEPAAFTKISALGVEEQRVNIIADFREEQLALSRLGDAFRVEARIIIWRGEDILTVPTSALFREEGTWKSFVIKNGKAQKVSLTIGRRNATQAEVLSGLQLNDQVITYPNDMTQDGVQVKLKGSGLGKSE